MRLTPSFFLLLSSVTAYAEPATLTCGGTFYQYEPEHVQGTMAPAATVVDLDRRTIETPVGKFPITTVSETKVHFGETGQLIVSGMLDRHTGLMTVSFRRPEEEQKIQAGKTARNTLYAEFTCAPGRRLF
jgi:hypothetical protein